MKEINIDGISKKTFCEILIYVCGVCVKETLIIYRILFHQCVIH